MNFSTRIYLDLDTVTSFISLAKSSFAQDSAGRPRVKRPLALRSHITQRLIEPDIHRCPRPVDAVRSTK